MNKLYTLKHKTEDRWVGKKRPYGSRKTTTFLCKAAFWFRRSDAICTQNWSKDFRNNYIIYEVQIDDVIVE